MNSSIGSKTIKHYSITTNHWFYKVNQAWITSILLCQATVNVVDLKALAGHACLCSFL